MPSAPSGACPSADARRNRASRLSAFFIPRPGIPWGGCRLFPGCPRASPYLHVRLTSLACPGGRAAFRHRSFPAPPLLGGCRAAEARFPSVEADLQARSRSVANLYPRGCISVSAQVQVCIRAAAENYPCGYRFSFGQIRPCIRAGATFHPGRCDPASVQVRFLQPVRYKETPAGLPWRILAGVNLFLFKFRASSHRLQGFIPSAARLLLPFRPAFLRVVPPASGARPRRAVWRR